ncbi:MAG: AI-2E family transporter [Victivallales bacterium]|nr:AI-2E family transporter [Victivallales bacterium]
MTGFLVNTSRNLFSGALKLLGKVLSKTWLTVFNFFLMLFVMFFVFYDGQNIMKYARDSIPLGAEEQQQVLQRIKEVSSSIAFSIFGTALCQAIVAMIIFRIVGIPALFWGSMLGMCSIIPFVGTSLIWVPATLYLFATGQIWQACVMLAGGLLVANIDNVLRPFLMKKGGKTGMSYLVLFFAILGGLQTFGLVGVIYGPLIFGICGICLLLFSTQFKKEHINQ